MNLFLYILYVQFIGETPAYIVEESILDPVSNTFTTYTKNITLTSYMTVEEKCVYSVPKSNSEWYIYIYIYVCVCVYSF